MLKKTLDLINYKNVMFIKKYMHNIVIGNCPKTMNNICINIAIQLLIPLYHI